MGAKTQEKETTVAVCRSQDKEDQILNFFFSLFLLNITLKKKKGKRPTEMIRRDLTG